MCEFIELYYKFKLILIIPVAIFKLPGKQNRTELGWYNTSGDLSGLKYVYMPIPAVGTV